MNKKKKGLWFIFVLLSILLLGITIFSLDEFKQEKTVKIIFIPKAQDPSNNFWMSMISGAKSAAKEYQADLTIMAPDTESDFEKQIAYLEEAIRLKPDVIALAPIQYEEMTETVKQVKEAGISLILIDSKLNEDIQESYIGTDNGKAGLELGIKMRDYIRDNTKIAIMSYMKEASTAMEREEGVRKGLGEEASRIETILYCNSDYDQAYALTMKLMEEKPETNLIVGLNLYSTVGVARAIKELKLPQKVNIVGFDNDLEGIQYLEEGIIDTLIVQKPFNMGYLGIQKAVEAGQGQKVEKNIFSEMEIITVDNIYRNENQKLLFPF